MKNRPKLAWLLLLFAPAAWATSFYIDPVTGNDSLGDGSAAKPWRTLQHVIDDGLLATRDWPGYPYAEGMELVPVHPDAPVRAGDTLWLRSGYYGDLVIAHAYNTSAITIAAEPGQLPRFRSVLVQSAQNWVLRGLSVSPSYATTNEQITMVRVRDHNWFGPASDIELAGLDLFSVADASGWGADEWVNLASSGMEIGAAHVNAHDNRLRNVRFGISVGGDYATVRHNTIDGFSADGLRGLGDHGLFEYNIVRDSYIGSPDDENHDDGFQSWSVGPDGVGSGVVKDVVLRGNVFISATDPDNPLHGGMQGIGCFDGFFEGWLVENNVVVTDHWHGISFYGMRDSRIVNNTVINRTDSSVGPPWIMVHTHKDGSANSSVLVRNNLATDYALADEGVNEDHNLLIGDHAGDWFAGAPLDLHLRAGTAPVDAGNAALAPAADAEGVPRPQGAGVDIGAYEWRGDVIFADGFETITP